MLNDGEYVVRSAPRARAARSLAQLPPRRTRFSSVQLLFEYEQCRLSVHSLTLPAISSSPSGVAPFGKVPTGAVAPQPSSPGYIILESQRSNLGFKRLHSTPQPLSLNSSGTVDPHGYVRPALPRAAYSHSSSVG